MKKFAAFFLIITFCAIQITRAQSQQTNTDQKQSYITVNIPKTPESAGFEKYGNPQVNEFSGTSTISIPLYTAKGRFLEVPITLSYSTGGIKVNQEASWVGLGFDLIAGGRITVETRGSVDFCGTTQLLSNHTALVTGMQKIFNRLGNSRENAVATFATVCGLASCPDPGYDYDPAIQEMMQFGTGEPDIFRANFMGHSMSFYIDKISGALKFIGEKNLFKIDYTLDGNNNITNWTIVDNNGIKYLFNQTETTTNTQSSNPVVPATTTSAWLLTRVEHPNGDFVNFAYSNYGLSVPAFSMVGTVNYTSATADITLPSDQFQNVSIQSPFYLTQIETSNTLVNFLLSTRTDLYGPGSRKLDQINVVDKPSGQVKKTIGFNYGYFQSASNPASTYLNSLSYSLPSPLSQSDYLGTSGTRLKLVAVTLNDGTIQPPYKFYYNEFTPDKYSYSQDHWGFYNAVNNTAGGYRFTHLIPANGLKGVNSTIPGLGLDLIGQSRDCNASAMQAMVLTKVEYPTGGSSEFTYETHNSTMIPTVNVIGGGLRVSQIKNFTQGKLAGVTAYSYFGGKYLGNIQYYTTSNELASCSSSPVSGHMKYSSAGAVNDDQALIGYNKVIITQKDQNGQSNGSLTKTFNITTNSSAYSNGGGFDIQAPYFSQNEPSSPVGGQTWDFWLDATHKNFAPTPSSNLEGKLIKEEYADNAGVIIKSVETTYRIVNYTNDLYDIKAIQNRQGGLDACPSGNSDLGFGSGGNRPVILFVSPAKSFFVVTDKVVEKTYSGSQSLSVTKSYQYNSFFQPVVETMDNSDGSQTITYSKTAADMGSQYHYTLPGTTDGNKTMNLASAHIYDPPVEQTVVNKSVIGDQRVVSSRLNVYDKLLPQKVYILETAQPITYNSQFLPVYYNYPDFPNYPSTNDASLKMDDRYKLYSTADYSSAGLISTLHTLQTNTAYLWDEANNTLIAQCTNTDINNIAATSFETAATGRWSYPSAGAVLDATAPTGNSVYSMGAGQVSLSGLNANQTYIISYWLKGGSLTISGGQPILTGRTLNGWTYYEQKITGSTSVTIGGNGNIDELRLFPSNSQMVTYTYEPLRGITSQCDPNNRISYYSYDAIGRLQYIKDQDGNIIKTIAYHNQSIPGFIH